MDSFHLNRSSALVGLLVLAVVGDVSSAHATPIRGRLANPGFENLRIKATLFFAGQALDGTNACTCGTVPACNAPNCPNSIYTMHPSDDALLHWSESDANRRLPIEQMVNAGVNVINMSSWGESFLSCDGWRTGAAPMQTCPAAHDQLFQAATPYPLLVAPFIESRGGSLPWLFRDEYPTAPDGRTAPGTISQIDDLVRRYLLNPANPEWAGKWAQVYDRVGEPRYAVVIIHAASNRLQPGDDAAFALGFDAIAAQVFRDTGKSVGFFLDALPPGTNAPGALRPSAGITGPWLATTLSVLGVECFAPEIWIGSSDTGAVINWKRSFSQGWSQSGLPFLMDVSSGYDGHIIFPLAPTYGLSATWLCELGQMVHDFGAGGMVFNSWNGYTEGMVAAPTQEHGTFFYDWVRSLQLSDVWAANPAPAARNGTWTCPNTLLEALANVPVGGVLALEPTSANPFAAPPPITKPCTIVAPFGPATIGF